jgi:hypothetical protein
MRHRRDASGFRQTLESRDGEAEKRTLRGEAVAEVGHQNGLPTRAAAWHQCPMKPVLLLPLLATVLFTAACTDSKRARNDATWGDRPAQITCWSYGVQNFEGRSTGKVEYDDGGRISFVDAANNRYTTIDGDCRVVYDPKPN